MKSKNSPIKNEDLPKTENGGLQETIDVSNNLKNYNLAIEKALKDSIEKFEQAEKGNVTTLNGVVLKNIKDAKDSKDYPDLINDKAKKLDKDSEDNKNKTDTKTHEDKNKSDVKREKDNQKKIQKDVKDHPKSKTVFKNSIEFPALSDELIDEMIDTLKKMKKS